MWPGQTCWYHGFIEAWTREMAAACWEMCKVGLCVMVHKASILSKNGLSVCLFCTVYLDILSAVCCRASLKKKGGAMYSKQYYSRNYVPYKIPYINMIIRPSLNDRVDINE